ncbi:aldehyde dehydrogenase family protein, partial [Cellulomonas septica]
AWAATPPARRAAVLRAAAVALERARGDLVATMVHEASKTVAEADPEVSEAVDFARYYADRAEELADGSVPGAVHRPSGVTVVTPPWNFPVAIPVGSVLASLAAGSPVLIKPAPATPRCAQVAMAAILRALDDAGAPAGTLTVVLSPEGDVGRRLVTHPDVARVVLTGSIETARLFAGWRDDLDVLAETSGKNALVITPSADVDLAVADLVKSAFGHAGQKCSAASLAILVGSAGTDDRLRRQLADAVSSLRVGHSDDLATSVPPLVEPASGKLLRALTTLDEGEEWLVAPRPLDVSGRLWTPGVRHGVAPGSWFHTTECFGPVLGIMRARTLDEAIAWQNAVAFGLTGGLHSLDEDEITTWLDRVEVGNAYVNRGTTGAIVRRQPFGGWKASVVGPGAKAGGPHYVAQLGTWSDAPDVPTDDAAWLDRARADDRRAWEEMFGREHDPSGLAVEQNVLRYRSVPALTVRVGDDARPAAVQRVLHAAATAGVPTTVSDV